MKKAIMVGALAAAAIPAAQAVDFKAGDWNLSVGGMVNAYYTQVSCSGDGNGNAVGGLALAGKALGCGGENNRTTIGNGLLPNGLVTSATSRQGDYDVKALIGMYNATATDSAISANSGVDVRQAYFSFGNDRMGTIKLGRDNGIFGAGAIFGDMTLIGAGAPVQATQRGRVTLGHLGDVVVVDSPCGVGTGRARLRGMTGGSVRMCAHAWSSHPQCAPSVFCSGRGRFRVGF